MARAVGLFCSLILLAPAAIFAWSQLGLPLWGWMLPFLHIAWSIPVLVGCTLAGFFGFVLSMRKLAERDEPLAPPR